MQIKIAPRQIQNDEKDDSASKVESKESNFNPKLCATLEELEKGKLPPEEILSLPMFKVLQSIIYNRDNYTLALILLLLVLGN